ncbi:hypothetical protein TW85_03345 [Marinomonas sp. S3726]|uniref:peptidoglycan bridge formation glycyltransferase FemA/FemB family protein n=1 Tax=Marinomonas sp. S3726 TaxID=579484 RepID=UPI0005FA71C6|nr:peptidoglycan bridge formation glycyltransferase FemA/FemB family protein [Marinomonas sp. S3726]KJZ15931.1 hypothetical protein TW85_03345 [Marinomonas sp. S3726]
MKKFLKPTFDLGFFCNKAEPLETLNRYWSDSNDVVGWLSRSSISFLQIAVWKFALTGNKPRFWFPSYICDDALIPLKKFGCEVMFYNAGEDLNYHACIKQFDDLNCDLDVLVYVHYFGKIDAPGISDIAEYSKRKKIWLVEDAAHVYIKAGNVGKYGDFTVFSPHKRFNIPSGSALVIKNADVISFFSLANQDNILVNDLSEELIKSLEGDVDCHSSSKRIHENLRWIIKESARKLVGSIGYSYDKQVLNSSTCQDKFEKDKVIPSPKLKDLTFSLLSRYVGRVSVFQKQHVRVRCAWLELVKAFSEFHDVEIVVNHSDSDYMLPIQLKGVKGEMFDLGNALSQIGVPVLKWPNLPKQISKDITNSALALYKSSYMLPINASISEEAIFALVRSIRRKAKEETLELVDLNVDVKTNDDGECFPRPFVQSLAYSRARSNTSSSSLVKVKVRSTSDENMFFSYIRKKKYMFTSLNTSSFGPVMSGGTEEKEIAFLSMLGKKYGAWFKAHVLMITPNIPLNGSSMYKLWVAGYRRVGNSNWSSSRIDLSQSEERIRGALNKKWRNQLVKAERCNFELIESTNTNDVLQVFELSEQYLSSIGIQSVSKDLVKELLVEASKGDSDLTLRVQRVYSDNELIGGVIIAESNGEATYFFGWSSELGRKNYVTQLLLWNGILSSKEQGLSLFDLGGIDHVGSPGVAKFKQGLNGEEYINVGTFLYVPRLFRFKV